MSVLAIDSGTDRFVREIVDRAWTAVRLTPRSVSFPVLGAALSLGSSLGFLFARALAAGRAPTMSWALDDIAQARGIYAYVTLSSLALVVPFGHYLGRWGDRARLLSITDPLTGVFNRRHFGERLTREARRTRRGDRPTSVLCLDVDHLKQINDRFGHKTGDDALVALARTISQSVRSTDVVARCGGDEFIVLLPRSGREEASAVAQRILAAVTVQGELLAWQFEVSIGIAEMSASAAAGDVVAAADAALYMAKAAGGARARVAPQDSALLAQQFTLSQAALFITSHGSDLRRST